MTRFEAIILFLAAMREHVEVFADEPRLFALAVDKLPNNAVAKLFWTHEGVAGRDCFDFKEALVVAQSATLIYFEAPEYRNVRLTFGQRVINRYLTGEHVEAARELAQEYLEQLKSTTTWSDL